MTDENRYGKSVYKKRVMYIAIKYNDKCHYKVDFINNLKTNVMKKQFKVTAVSMLPMIKTLVKVFTYMKDI
jgi:hypothetical protein